jgi:hypothetical protein
MGYRFVGVSSDVQVLMAAARTALANVRGPKPSP